MFKLHSRTLQNTYEQLTMLIVAIGAEAALHTLGKLAVIFRLIANIFASLFTWGTTWMVLTTMLTHNCWEGENEKHMHYHLLVKCITDTSGVCIHTFKLL